MRKNNLKKAISIILLIMVLLITLSTAVSARYQYIAILGASLSINSNGLATCEGQVRPSDNDTSTTLTVELQKQSNGWIYVDSWSTSGEGARNIIKSAQKYIARGKYRVVVTAKVYSSSGSLLENQSVISHEVTY